MPLLITRTSVQEIQADMIIYIRQKEHSNIITKENFLHKCIKGIRRVTAEKRVRYVEYTEETACSQFGKEYEKALKWAVRHGWEGVAVSCEGEAAFELAAEAGKAFSQEHDLYIYLCIPQGVCYPASMLASALAIIPYLEDSSHYVHQPKVEEERFSSLTYDKQYISSDLEDEYEAPLLDEEDQDFGIWEEACHPQVSSQEYLPQEASPPKKQEMPRPQDVFPQAEQPKASGSFRAIQEFLKKNDAGFKDTLLKYIDRTGKKDSEIYKKANVDRRLFSKIMNVQGYNPSKPTAIAFAIALELNLEETKDLIGRAGYTLSQASTFDRIIEFFILEGNFDIYEINEALFYFDQSLLGC